MALFYPIRQAGEILAAVAGNFASANETHIMLARPNRLELQQLPEGDGRIDDVPTARCFPVEGKVKRLERWHVRGELLDWLYVVLEESEHGELLSCVLAYDDGWLIERPGYSCAQPFENIALNSWNGIIAQSRGKDVVFRNSTGLLEHVHLFYDVSRIEWLDSTTLALLCKEKIAFISIDDTHTFTLRSSVVLPDIILPSSGEYEFVHVREGILAIATLAHVFFLDVDDSDGFSVQVRLELWPPEVPILYGGPIRVSGTSQLVLLGNCLAMATLSPHVTTCTFLSVGFIPRRIFSVAVLANSSNATCLLEDHRGMLYWTHIPSSTEDNTIFSAKKLLDWPTDSLFIESHNRAFHAVSVDGYSEFIVASQVELEFACFKRPIYFDISGTGLERIPGATRLLPIDSTETVVATEGTGEGELLAAKGEVRVTASSISTGTRSIGVNGAYLAWTDGHEASVAVTVATDDGPATVVNIYDCDNDLKLVSSHAFDALVAIHGRLLCCNLELYLNGVVYTLPAPAAAAVPVGTYDALVGTMDGRLYLCGSQKTLSIGSGPVSLFKLDTGPFPALALCAGAAWLVSGTERTLNITEVSHMGGLTPESIIDVASLPGREEVAVLSRQGQLAVGKLRVSKPMKAFEEPFFPNISTMWLDHESLVYYALVGTQRLMGFQHLPGHPTTEWNILRNDYVPLFESDPENFEAFMGGEVLPLSFGTPDKLKLRRSLLVIGSCKQRNIQRRVTYLLCVRPNGDQCQVSPTAVVTVGSVHIDVLPPIVPGVARILVAYTNTVEILLVSEENLELTGSRLLPSPQILYGFVTGGDYYVFQGSESVGPAMCGIFDDIESYVSDPSVQRCLPQLTIPRLGCSSAVDGSAMAPPYILAIGDASSRQRSCSVMLLEPRESTRRISIGCSMKMEWIFKAVAPDPRQMGLLRRKGHLEAAVAPVAFLLSARSSITSVALIRDEALTCDLISLEDATRKELWKRTPSLVDYECSHKSESLQTINGWFLDFVFNLSLPQRRCFYESANISIERGESIRNAIAAATS